MKVVTVYWRSGIRATIPRGTVHYDDISSINTNGTTMLYEEFSELICIGITLERLVEEQ